jgi:hypothetical protein
MHTSNSLNSGTETTGSSPFELAPESTADTATPQILPSPARPPSESSSDCESCDASVSPLPQALLPTSADQIEIGLTSDGKRCYSCRRYMPLEAFVRAVINGVEYRVRRCNNCRAYRQKNSPKIQTRKAMLAEAKSKPCTDCKGCFPTECMEFDRVRSAKKFQVSSAFLWMRLNRLKEELEKCELVCCNCHRIRTVKRKQRTGRPTKYLADLPFDPKYVEPVNSSRANRL